MFVNANFSSGTLVTPKGFRITGVTGTVGTGMNPGIMGFSLIIAR